MTPASPGQGFDFYKMLSDQASSIGAEDYEQTDLALHPSVEEYLRWRHGELLLYGSVGDMPAEVALGFQYLCRMFGKEGLTSVDAMHAAIAESSRREAEIRNQLIMGG